MYSIELERDHEGNPRKTKDGRYYLFSLITKSDDGEVAWTTKGCRLKTDLSLLLLPTISYHNKIIPIVEMTPIFYTRLIGWFKQNPVLFRRCAPENPFRLPLDAVHYDPQTKVVTLDGGVKLRRINDTGEDKRDWELVT